MLSQKKIGPLLPSPPPDALYRQPNVPIDVRVNDLLTRMTLEEKIGQMALVDKNSLSNIQDVSHYHLGAVLSGAGAKPRINTPAHWQEMVLSFRQEALRTRLGIPILYGIDANHGNANVLGATIFPHAIGLGASHDKELVQQVAAATANEMKAVGLNWTYSPSLDAPKDIRWGRVYEAFSDNPQLNAELGTAYIQGTQIAADNKVSTPYTLATAKHFVGTGAMIWGSSYNKRFKIDQGTTVPSQQLLDSQYLLPFNAAVDAHVSSVMVSLNHWGETRTIDSSQLVNDKLKKELNFQGFVVSDWYGGYEYARSSHYEANITSINAGLDMMMLPFEYKKFISDVRTAVSRGRIKQSRIDDATRRILYQKFKAGLFDEILVSRKQNDVGSAKNRLLARKAVAASAVLLKNSAATLPLSKNGLKILVAGDSADNVGKQCGAWTVEWQGVNGNWLPGSTSILQGIRNTVGSNTKIDYDRNGLFPTTSSKADVGIVVVGEAPYAEGLGDNANPQLSDNDLKTIERVRQASTRVIVIIVAGRPLLISQQIPNWDVAIMAWLPGSEGSGIADVLFGNQNFTARLPISWPARLSQIPVEPSGLTADQSKLLFLRDYGL
ncbi:MAG: glycoside hydrolase family 3 N-terminal domain-containing protein [Candidatus Saccharimonadales bacterium]